MPQAVWLDADPGFDDWLTMLLLAQGALDWRGMSVVHGNAPLSFTLRNTLDVCAFHGLKVPVWAGCAQALSSNGSASQVTAQSVLGVKGMRTTASPLPQTQAQAHRGNAIDQLAAAVEAANDELIVIATGPLTNIAQFVIQFPALAKRVKALLWMGGSTDTGNHTAAAEFNAYADPHAASIVFQSGIPVSMFGLNLCRQVNVTQAHVQQVAAVGSFEAQCFSGYFDAYQRIRSADGSVPMPLYDPVVAAYLLAPHLFELKAAHVAVELQGLHTLGMTVCDFKLKQHPANAKVATLAQGEQVMQLILEKLRAFFQRAR
jgi:purine nucleosidase